MKATYFALAVLAALTACQKAEAPATAQEALPEPGTREWKIRNARSAAPEAISAAAMVVSVKDSTGALDTLAPAGAGSGWVCFADDSRTPHNDPACIDSEAMKWVTAMMAQQARPPRLLGMGVGYALQGGAVASDTDPLKMTPDSGWIMDGPSIYIAMPNASAYQGLPTARRSDGPWVRYSGTPYAHIVLPAGR